jgi:phenylacetate-coenzyme A ligase PaaK-like adenylate-forming protein
MDNQEKAQKYNQLMYVYTKIQNQISSIKGESLELNNVQLREISLLENKLRTIMEEASRL